MKAKLNKAAKALWTIFGYVYMPVYFIFWILLKLVRVLLAIVHLGLLDFRVSKDIIKNLFVNHGRY